MRVGIGPIHDWRVGHGQKLVVVGSVFPWAQGIRVGEWTYRVQETFDALRHCRYILTSRPRYGRLMAGFQSAFLPLEVGGRWSVACLLARGAGRAESLGAGLNMLLLFWRGPIGTLIECGFCRGWQWPAWVLLDGVR